MREKRVHDPVPETVAHIYDVTARGKVEVQDPEDPVIMVRWSDSKERLTPCIRAEVCSVDLPKKKIKRSKRVKKDADEHDDEE